MSGRKDNHGFDPAERSGLMAHVEGACGEIAVAKLINRFWSPSINTFKASDIGRRIQVRARSRHDYDLIVREDDADDDIFCLVTGLAPHFVYRGCILGSAAKKPEYLLAPAGRPPAWFVPQVALDASLARR